jgi:hypothetical protein
MLSPTLILSGPTPKLETSNVALAPENWASYVSSVLDAAGYEATDASTISMQDEQIVVECDVLAGRGGPGSPQRAQIFIGNDPQPLAEQLAAHFALCTSGITTILDDLLFLPAIRFPVLLFRETRQFPLTQLMRTPPAFKFASLIAWDLIQAARISHQLGTALGPVSPGRCRVSSDGSFKTRIHLFTTQSYELLRCHPEQIRAKLRGEPLPLSWHYDLWSIGLLFFELFFGVALQVELARLLQNDISAASVACLYEKYLQVSEQESTETQCFSFAVFCFPALLVTAKSLGLMQSANSLMCLCMKPNLQDRLLPDKIQDAWFAVAGKDKQAYPLLEARKAPCIFGNCTQEALRLLQNPGSRAGSLLECESLHNKLSRCGQAPLSERVQAIVSRLHVTPGAVLNLLLTLLYPRAELRKNVIKSTGVEPFLLDCDELWKNRDALLLALATFAKRKPS